MIIKVSIVIGTIGIAKLGKPPDRLARSPTRCTSRSNPRTTAVTTPMASKGAGTRRVRRGVNQIKTIVATTNPQVKINVSPDNQLV